MFSLSSNFRSEPGTAHTLAVSPTLQINERVNQMWAAGEQVYHLGFGESRFPIHPKLQEALKANSHQNSYLPGQGLPELRSAIAQFYSTYFKIPTTSAQVIVGPGSKSLIYALQMAMDAHLILPTPSWVSYEPQARLLNRPCSIIPASPADGYAWGVDALKQIVKQAGDGPKILLINSPNNPTGQMFDGPFLQELADYCRREQIVVLSDEIYGLVPHGHKPHISLAHYYPEGTVVLGGLSKHLSLGGWRLGTAILPAHEQGILLMKALRTIASEIWSTPAAPIQYASLTAYGDDPEIIDYVKECAQIHGIRTQHLWQWLVEFGIDCAQPDGGFYMFPNFDQWREPLAKRGIHTSDELAKHLLDEYQIATLPGVAFGAPAADLSLRLATSYVDMETGKKAGAVLEAYRANADSTDFMNEPHPVMGETIQRLQQFVESLA